MSTRAERKAARNEHFARQSEIDTQATQQKAQREAEEKERKRIWAITHPVSSGLIPVVDYTPPRGRYIPAPALGY